MFAFFFMVFMFLLNRLTSQHRILYNWLSNFSDAQTSKTAVSFLRTITLSVSHCMYSTNNILQIKFLLACLEEVYLQYKNTFM